MKELLKKASLTVASACLIAGGLLSVGWAGSNQSEQSARHQYATSSEKEREEAGHPKDITVNGERYSPVSGGGRPHIGCAWHPKCGEWRHHQE